MRNEDVFRLRLADENDVDITYKWASDEKIRQFFFNREIVKEDIHRKWFFNKIKEVNCLYLILVDLSNTPFGSVRVDIQGEQGLISYLIDTDYQGKGIGQKMLQLLEEYLKKNTEISFLKGVVLEGNQASSHIFRKLNYIEEKDQNTCVYTKSIR